MSKDAGGGGGGDLRAAGLGEIAKGITLTLEELRELGIDSLAGVGRGFSELQLSGLKLGHGDLTSAYTSFCERWEWGVRALVAEGNNFAEGVQLSAGTYYETDQYVEGAMKIVVNSAAGNPYAGEDEIARMSWGELRHNHPYANPDFSAESFEQARENSGQGWKDAGRDVMTSQTLGPVPGLTPENLRGVAGVGDGEYEQGLDESFGPSAEERGQAAEEGSGQGGHAG
ncbi:hypothetical protein [Streptomyces resistomycificus]|uniref:Uncharacterized protein n=1 Tax=Streptomyces resistomycificus TaxID=67356 RepID=A0A0L8L4E0_9ACTN|nr:hypothetical protein [Streptomyces resistomycificus]KOG32941.1 hypothetical protein ADK37_24825 [Streptomyces resistomycificus]KUN92102.1 hypothetical protein AQJ84_34310 [Streptomyces resistomycificus]